MNLPYVAFSEMYFFRQMLLFSYSITSEKIGRDKNGLQGKDTALGNVGGSAVHLV